MSPRRLFQANTSLLAVQIQYTPQNYNVSFTFAGLSENTTYWMFHFATVDDPTLTALSTAVTSMSVTTLASSTIDINFSARTLAPALVSLALAVLMIG